MRNLAKLMVLVGLAVAAVAAQAAPETELRIGHAGGPGVVPVAMAAVDLLGSRQVELLPMTVESRKELVGALVEHHVDCGVLSLTEAAEANVLSGGAVQIVSILGRDGSATDPDAIQTLACNARLPRDAVIWTQAAVARTQDRLIKGGEPAARFGVAVAERSGDLVVDADERERLVRVLVDDGVFIEKRGAISGGIDIGEMGLLHEETVARWKRGRVATFAASK